MRRGQLPQIDETRLPAVTPKRIGSQAHRGKPPANAKYYRDLPPAQIAAIIDYELKMNKYRRNHPDA